MHNSSVATAPLLKIEQLTIRFKNANINALNNLNLEVNSNDTIAIVGESGSGKSLLALSIIGLLTKEANQTGSLFFEGKNMQFFSKKDWQKIRGAEISIVFQEPMTALNPILSIGFQLQEAILQKSKISKKEAKIKAIEWLNKVHIPTPEISFNKYPHQLSGGQKQRIMIAMAMCNGPKILIADEPSTALDATIQHEIIQLIQALQKENGGAVLFITHDLGLAAQIATNILVLKKGEVIELNTTDHIINDPQEDYTKALFSCKPSINHKTDRLLTIDDVFNEKKYEKSITKKPIESSSESSELRVSELNIQFPLKKNWIGTTTQWFQAVENIAFTLPLSKTLGIVGESGCGKSTIGKALCGIIPFQKGSISLNDSVLDYKTSEGKNHVRSQIQMVFQDPSAALNPKFKIRKLLAEAVDQAEKIGNNSLKFTSSQLLEMVQLPLESLDKYPHQFSGGQKQRIAIARTLALQPKILICDESVSALDLSVQAQILNLLRDLQQQLKLTMLFISHDLAVVHHISDYVAVMRQGKIIEFGDVTSIIHNPKEAYTKYLIANTH